MSRLTRALLIGILGGLGASGACVFFWGFLQNFVDLPSPDLFQEMSTGAKCALTLALGLPFALRYWVTSRPRSHPPVEGDPPSSSAPR